MDRTVYAEITSVDKKLGALILCEDEDEVIMECMKWIQDNNLDVDTVAPCELKSRQGDVPLGKIALERKDKLVYTPYELDNPIS